MASRPVFIALPDRRCFTAESVEFPYYGGFALSQKQKCSGSLHTACIGLHPDLRVLEISSASPLPLGVSLSAFNLMIETKKAAFSVETAYQASKVFENGGPYGDILALSSRDAKRDPRLNTSGALVGFSYFQRSFPLVPRSFFYNWLYINALMTHPELAEAVLDFDAFTDISVNPARSVSCQAQAAAVFVSLSRRGLATGELKDPEAFLTAVYGGGNGSRPEKTEPWQQTSMFQP